MALEFNIEVCMLGEGDFEHGRVGRVIEQLPWDMPPVQVMSNLLCCVPVCVLDQGLKACALLEGCDLADEAES